jgi:hypothetical protein
VYTYSVIPGGLLTLEVPFVATHRFIPSLTSCQLTDSAAAISRAPLVSRKFCPKNSVVMAEAGLESIAAKDGPAAALMQLFLKLRTCTACKQGHNSSALRQAAQWPSSRSRYSAI